MKRQSRRIPSLLAVLGTIPLFLILSTSVAQSRVEVGTFLAVPVDVVGEGMAGTDVARWAQGISPFANPAAAATRRPAVALTHGLLLADQNLSALSVQLPLQGGRGGLAIMGRMVNHAKVPRFDTGGNRLASLSPQDLSLGLAYGYRFGMLTLGGGAHYVQENLDIAKGTGFAYDLGGLLQLGPAKLGLSGTNLFGSLDYDGENYDIPRNISAGGAVRIQRAHLELTAAYNDRQFGSEELAFGLQWSWFQGILTLRGGYVSTLDSATDESFSPYRFGFSVGHSGIAVDYAYVPHQELGQVHFFAIRWLGR